MIGEEIDGAIILLSKIVKIPIVGQIDGICRITGTQSKGVFFDKWVKDTFNDSSFLFKGNIISNEALFCFDEASELIMQKTGKDKPQRFRTYSHIITKNNDWLCLTKADKKQIATLIKTDNIKVLCLTDTGQKHIFFKHKIGFWQLDETFIQPNIPLFEQLHSDMLALINIGFGQEQIKTGNYNHSTILKVGLEVWQELESKLSKFRGEPIFDLAAWLMYNEKTNEAK